MRDSAESALGSLREIGDSIAAMRIEEESTVRLVQELVDSSNSTQHLVLQSLEESGLGRLERSVQPRLETLRGQCESIVRSRRDDVEELATVIQRSISTLDTETLEKQVSLFLSMEEQSKAALGPILGGIDELDLVCGNAEAQLLRPHEEAAAQTSQLREVASRLDELYERMAAESWRNKALPALRDLNSILFEMRRLLEDMGKGFELSIGMLDEQLTSYIGAGEEGEPAPVKLLHRRREEVNSIISDITSIAEQSTIIGNALVELSKSVAPLNVVDLRGDLALVLKTFKTYCEKSGRFEAEARAGFSGLRDSLQELGARTQAWIPEERAVESELGEIVRSIEAAKAVFGGALSAGELTLEGASRLKGATSESSERLRRALDRRMAHLSDVEEKTRKLDLSFEALSNTLDESDRFRREFLDLSGLRLREQVSHVLSRCERLQVELSSQIGGFRSRLDGLEALRSQLGTEIGRAHV